MMQETNKLLLAFYGDDFTGSTDALEFLSRAGAKAVLFIEPPGPEQLKRYPGLQAIGVAGMSRSMNPQEMEKELYPAFSALKALGASHVHYKVCSTFDSSPRTGSIGKAIDIGAEVFNAGFVPLLVAAPALGRYCVFGNLFARMGTAGKGEIYRLDRHPSMSRHPVTPADESDLRLHLSRQTSKKIALMDILQVDKGQAEAQEILNSIIRNNAEVVLFDALYQQQMAGIGRLLDGLAEHREPLFSAGSSGIEMALGDHWAVNGRLQKRVPWPAPGFAGPLLAVSGSCSPVTSAQISRAVSEGFAEIVLKPERLASSPSVEDYIERAARLINEGRSVILHTGAEGQKPAQLYSSQLLGTALGLTVRGIAGQTRVRRVVIAGGDTSSYAARAMGIEAVEMIAPIVPGAPLCKAYAPGSPVDGLEVNFKGGQVGSEDYFEKVMKGGMGSYEL